MEDIKDITDVVGKFGLWQKSYFAIAFYTESVLSWVFFALTFMAPDVPFACIRYDKLNANDVLQLRDNGTTDQCFALVNETKHACLEWIYMHNESVFTSTLTEKFDFVCDREFFVSLANSLNLFANFVGILFFGYLADRYGRRKALLLPAFTLQVSNLLLLFAPNVEVFLLARFVNGFTAFETVILVLLSEIVSVEHRATLSSLIWIGWALAYAGFAGIAYLLPNWFDLQLFCTCASLPILLMICLVPESPRWLLLKDRKEQARTVMTRAAKWNGMHADNMMHDIETLETILKEKSTEETQRMYRYNFLDFLRLRKSRNRTFILFSIWFGITFLYYGISLNSEVFGGNLFLNFSLLGIIEIPSYALSAIGCHYWTRRGLLITTLSGAGIASLLIYPLHDNLIPVRITLVVVMKLCITISYTIIFLYSAETFPTGVRSLGMALCNSVSGIAGAISPFVNEMSDAIGLGYSMAVLGVFGVALGMLAYFLPETKDTSLPETLEDGERLGLHRCPCYNQNRARKTSLNTHNRQVLINPTPQDIPQL